MRVKIALTGLNACQIIPLITIKLGIVWPQKAKLSFMGAVQDMCDFMYYSSDLSTCSYKNFVVNAGLHCCRNYYKVSTQLASS